jgi:tRNA nucleotidyltransferase (CCA-adding enzyme)
MSTHFDFFTSDISQSDIRNFAESRVNLPKDHADAYRAQVRTLRENLETYLGQHPEVGLKKMLLSGSLAKGTALRTINDIDVGLYIASSQAPHQLGELLTWLVDRLRTTYHQMPPENIYIDEPCVVIAYKGTGLNVEITPILYDGDPQWRGFLWTRNSNEKIMTSIPLHLDFIKKRKDTQPSAFAQVVRLLKWWARQRAVDTADFELKSFLIELIMANAADSGSKFSDFHVGLENFFLYIQRTGLRDRIAFGDNYSIAGLPPRSSKPVEILDPVTAENNVAGTMTEKNRLAIVNASADALDALSYAKTCQTKQEALSCWKDLMGPTFTA